MSNYAECACGCGSLICHLDKKGRKISFASGHANSLKIDKYILPEYKICNCCKQNLPITNFELRKCKSKINNKEFYRPKSRCFECLNENRKTYKNLNSERVKEIDKRYHQKHFGTIKYHVQEKISTWRKASCTPSDLTVNYLVDLYNRQDGYCYYSGTKMIFGWVDGKVHHSSLSLDKLDPTKGYVQGNVVWCSYLVNTMKQNMNEMEFYNCLTNILNYKNKA